MPCSLPYVAIESSAAVEQNNHETRNALTPGLSSVEMLEHHWHKLTPEQRRKHLGRIKESISNAIAVLEENNSQIENGKILLFRKRLDCECQKF